MKVSASILLLFICCGSASALLPPYAETRAREVLDYRYRKQMQYEQAQEKHEMKMIQQDQLVRSRLLSPPWVNGEQQQREGIVRASGNSLKAWLSPSSSRVTAAIITFVLFGFAVWLIRFSTTPEA